VEATSTAKGCPFPILPVIQVILDYINIPAGDWHWQRLTIYMEVNEEYTAGSITKFGSTVNSITLPDGLASPTKRRS